MIIKDCNTCKEKNVCAIGSRMDTVDIGIDLPLDEKLKNPYYDPSLLYEPPHNLITIPSGNDISSLFSDDMRILILHEILNDRPDPESSSYSNPIYKTDLEQIQSSRKELILNNIDMTGIELLEKTSKFIIINDSITELDLRLNTNIHNLIIQSTSLKTLYLPNVFDKDDDYENEDTYTVDFDTQNLHYFNLSTMLETKAGIKDISKVENMSDLLFLVIPSNCYNQNFIGLNIENITENTNVNYLRLIYNITHSESDNVYVLNLKDFIHIPSGFIDDTSVINTIGNGIYNRGSKTIAWKNKKDIPEGIMIAEKISAILNKEGL